jgi:hypothetical protein
MNQAEPLHHPGQDALMTEWPLTPCFDQPYFGLVRAGSPVGGKQEEPLAFPPPEPPQPAGLPSGAEAITWTTTTWAWLQRRLRGPGEPA